MPCFPDLDFSLTEKLIINPTLQMRAAGRSDARCCEKFWNGIQAQVIARVVALFASIFAAVDCFVHLLTGASKAAYLQLTQCKCLKFLPPSDTSKATIREHFRQAGRFALITLVGSIAGSVWPGAFRPMRYSGPAQLIVTEKHGDKKEKGALFLNLPNDLVALVHKVQDLGSFKSIAKQALNVADTSVQKILQELEAYWKKSNLQNKHLFVQVFGYDFENYQRVREECAKIVYRHAKSDNPAPVKWLSAKEVDSECRNIFSRAISADQFSQGYFFHATPTEKGLESILKSRKIEVRHEKAFRGAFVSTKPETIFGKFVLALKRPIERLSKLEHGFKADETSYWAGFSRDIPVNEDTLAYIILNDDEKEKAAASEQERKALETQCQEWTKRKIDVILRSKVEERLKDVAKLNMGIPKEWPDEGPTAAAAILPFFRPAVAVAIAIRADGRSEAVSVQVSNLPTTRTAATATAAAPQQVALAVG